MSGDPVSVHREGFDILHVFGPRHYTVSVASQFLDVIRAAVVVHWEDNELGLRQDMVKRTLSRRIGRLGRRVLSCPVLRQGMCVTRRSLDWITRHASICDALTPALADNLTREMALPCVAVLPAMLADPDYAVSIGCGGQRAAARLFDLDRNIGTLLGVYRAAIDRTGRPDLSALTASSSDAR